jgi:hypothetical protein
MNVNELKTGDSIEYSTNGGKTIYNGHILDHTVDKAKVRTYDGNPLWIRKEQILYKTSTKLITDREPVMHPKEEFKFNFIPRSVEINHNTRLGNSFNYPNKSIMTGFVSYGKDYYQNDIVLPYDFDLGDVNSTTGVEFEVTIKRIK